MKKKYIVAVVIAVVALVVIVVITNPFANGNANIPNGSGNSTTNTTNPDRPPNTSNWIHPGKIYVDNYEPGATVVLELEVHNGNGPGVITYNWTIATGDGETQYNLSLTNSLEDDSLTSILLVKSNNPADQPVAINYDAKTLSLLISGLKESTERVLTVSFKQDGAMFSVDYRYPDGLTEGYSAPVGASDWVRSKEKFITIGARETYIAKVWLHMPSDATSPGDKWEFWIGVIDKSQTGMIVTELATRVLVTMK